MITKFLDSTSYNTLHTLFQANDLFTHREKVLQKLGPVLEQYGDNKFGVCIVHRHCLLEEGERMVSTNSGNTSISQPEKDGQDIHPERWLATGEAYEFSCERTPSPPEELFDNFRKVIGDVKVLGLFYVRHGGIDVVALERTEGRRNITDIVPRNTSRNAITTGWNSRSASQTAGLTAVPGQSSGPGETASLFECSCCDKTPPDSLHVMGTKMGQLMRMPGLGHLINKLG